jgi:hypothetical protein
MGTSNKPESYVDDFAELPTKIGILFSSIACGLLVNRLCGDTSGPDWPCSVRLLVLKKPRMTDVDEGSPVTNESNIGDIELITREKPMTIESWVEQNAAGFQ